jgi:hypothetical protein
MINKEGPFTSSSGQLPLSAITSGLSGLTIEEGSLLTASSQPLVAEGKGLAEEHSPMSIEEGSSSCRFPVAGEKETRQVDHQTCQDWGFPWKKVPIPLQSSWSWTGQRIPPKTPWRRILSKLHW